MRAWVVVDLGFGDAGKGAVVDALVRRNGATLVVRFNGGAQAGHTVVAPDGRTHTFSQLGAGTFAGASTHHGPDVVLHPLGLLVEARRLARLGEPDALARTTADPDCRLISPFQQAANRLRELDRGEEAHGTCGVGVGEAVGDALLHPDDALRASHLQDPGELRRRLRRQQDRKQAELGEAGGDDPRAGPERAWLAATDAVERVVEAWSAVPLALSDGERLLRDHPRVVFEGAQGVLLDETHGTAPHTTWSDCTPRGATRLLAAAGREARVLAVTRAYATRHGRGPFPQHDPGWDRRLPEPHNPDDGWQGAFRRGPLDLEALRFAARVAGPFDGLCVTCVDRVSAWPDVTVAGRAGPVGLEPERLPGFLAEGLGLPLEMIGRGPSAPERDWFTAP